MQMREWHQQMMGMHAQMAQMHDQSGQGALAKQHRQMERRHQRMMGTLPSELEPSEQQAAPDDGTETRAVRGEELYVQHCASCHGQQGEGFGESFPPLAGADWVEGEEDRPIRILLHGLQGQIQVKGQSYDSVMPAFGRRLSDREVAAILSHIRSSWGNEGEAIAKNDVREIREQHAGRTQPWTAGQLREEQ
jgi:mono/diheme cytochrome c family protein